MSLVVANVDVHNDVELFVVLWLLSFVKPESNPKGTLT